MKRFMAIFALSSLCLTATSSPAKADLEHVDQLADGIMSSASDLCWELYNFQRGRPGYEDTYRTTYEMWTVADHVHDMIHGNAANQRRIARNVADLDELLDKVSSDIAAWTGTGLSDDQQFGCPFRLKRKLAALDEAVEHLASDIGISREGGPVAVTGATTARPPVAPEPQAAPPQQ